MGIVFSGKYKVEALAHASSSSVEIGAIAETGSETCIQTLLPSIEMASSGSLDHGLSMAKEERYLKSNRSKVNSDRSRIFFGSQGIDNMHPFRSGQGLIKGSQNPVASNASWTACGVNLIPRSRAIGLSTAKPRANLLNSSTKGLKFWSFSTKDGSFFFHASPNASTKAALVSVISFFFLSFSINFCCSSLLRILKPLSSISMAGFSSSICQAITICLASTLLHASSANSFQETIGTPSGFSSLSRSRASYTSLLC